MYHLLFSAAGQVLTKRRSRLSDSRFEKLLLLKFNKELLKENLTQSNWPNVSVLYVHYSSYYFVKYLSLTTWISFKILYSM